MDKGQVGLWTSDGRSKAAKGMMLQASKAGREQKKGGGRGL